MNFLSRVKIHRQEMGLYLVLLLPALFFYAILWKNAVNLPIHDDYHAVLEFTNAWTNLNGFTPKLLHILTFQHNEYKLMFESAVIAAQYSLMGHINFFVLIAFGNLFVLGIFALLLAMFRFTSQVRSCTFLTALRLLSPLSLLLFQLQYATTLDWAMAGLQNVTVLFFSLGAILLLARCGKVHFALACICMLFAIACSGNGFITSVVGLLMLLQGARRLHALIWIGVTVLFSYVYFYHYNFHTSQAVAGAPVTQSLVHFNPFYVLSFLGSSIARYESYAISMILGALLLLVFLFAAIKRYDRSNPAVFYAMLFIVLTALGVAGLRANLGVAQSLASRYRIYSNLMLIFVYIYVVETTLSSKLSRLSLQSRLLLSCVSSLCLGFCALSDVAGGHFLQSRRNAVLQEMLIWQNRDSITSQSRLPNADSNAAFRRQMDLGNYKPDAAVLLDSIRLGVYRPPFTHK